MTVIRPVRPLRPAVGCAGAPAQDTAPRKLRRHIRFCTAPDGVRLAYATAGSGPPCGAADGVRLAYAIGGNGPPLVKAANWIGHLEYDQTTPVWRHWIAELSRDHRLLRYDMRGCGLSDRAVEDLSFEAHLSDLETVIEASGFAKFPILGISAGVPLAIAYAALHPERVGHLVLHAGFARGPALRPLTPEQREINETMPRLIELGWGQENPSFRRLFTSQIIPGGSPSSIAASTSSPAWRHRPRTPRGCCG
jgi:pimeloyl-ACP methyl ester carboxylesterase